MSNERNSRVVGVFVEKYSFMRSLRAKGTVQLEHGEEMPITSASEWYEPVGSGSFPTTRDGAIAVYRQEADKSKTEGRKAVSFTEINSDIIEELISLGKITTQPKRQAVGEATATFRARLMTWASPLYRNS